MSRQRIRSSVLESSTEKCPVCGGTGHMRSVSSVTLQLLRTLEEMLIKGGTHNLIVRTRSEVALYMLNHKRAHLRELEERFRITITVNADATVSGPQSFVIDKGEQVHSVEAARALAVQPATIVSTVGLAEEDGDEFDEESMPTLGEAVEDGQAGERLEGGGRRRRRRRRRRRGEEAEQPVSAHAEDEDDAEEPTEEPADIEPSDEEHEPVAALAESADGERRRRRRGRRGGRRRRGRDGEPIEPSAIEPELDRAVADFDRPALEVDAFPQPQAPLASLEDHETAPSQTAAGSIPSEDIADATFPGDTIPSESTPGETIPSEAAPSPTSEPERVRRGSTVREPAPYFAGADAAPSSPAPLVSNPGPEPHESVESAKPQTEEPSDQPRRTGWWSRRFAATKS